MEIYLDLVMILNFLVDFLLILGTNRLAGFPSEPGRSLVAAAFGGIYGGACMIPGFSFLGNLFWRGITLCLIGTVAFGCNRSTVKRIGVFLLLSLALGGLAVSLGRGDLPALAFAAACIWFLSHVSFGSRVGTSKYVPMTIRYGERAASMIALKDTGNTLRDPVTGEQVLLVANSIAQRLTGLTEQQIKEPIATLAQRPIPGLRLIPFSCIGTDHGMLLAMRFEDIQINRRSSSGVVAFAPAGLGQGGAYQALIAGD